jgi:hypothetical protein
MRKEEVKAGNKWFVNFYFSVKEEKFEDVYRLKKQMELARERIWSVYGYGNDVFLEAKIGFVNNDIVRNKRTICLSYYPIYCY